MKKKTRFEVSESLTTALLPGGPAEKPANEVVEMPAAGHTTKFPRKDNVYKKKESLAFDESIYSNVWINRQKNVAEEEFK